MNAINTQGKHFVGPGVVPFSYSSSNHFGYEGDQVVKIETSAPPAVTPTGSWIGGVTVGPVYVTSPGPGPIKKYTGTPSTPPHSFSSIA
jgi:hypothetical protein